MEIGDTEKIILWVLAFVFGVLYLYFFQFFFQDNYFWITLVLVYILGFFMYDSFIREKEFKEHCYKKKLCDTRIDFWINRYVLNF